MLLARPYVSLFVCYWPGKDILKNSANKSGLDSTSSGIGRILGIFKHTFYAKKNPYNGT